ncbi:MAG TPA: ribosome maturation factor RimM [Acidimicrobiales bacterium]|nr:ribosome maturation factor RimM [Acidimicrobiales bacterium]
MTTDPGPLLEVGHITKAHGLHGEVLVALTTTETSRLAAGSRLWVGDRWLVVAAAEPHQHRWIVRFAAVPDRGAAEALAGAVLRAEPKVDADDGDDAALWVHELIGAQVVDPAGHEWGTVVSVVANPASDLLELDSGTLVPLRFVVGAIARDGDRRLVHVDPPQGILE